ncbi:hypothetical protein JTB14_033017 [Gonioctena quinquepunctata]|nr:hypothetical protein JTB14_033017 [Gonioctena quinquepunctata]
MSQIQDRLSKIFLMKKVTIVLAKNPQTSKRISLIQILYFQGKQVFPNNIFEEETELEDHHRPTMIIHNRNVNEDEGYKTVNKKKPRRNAERQKKLIGNGEEDEEFLVHKPKAWHTSIE